MATEQQATNLTTLQSQFSDVRGSFVHNIIQAFDSMSSQPKVVDRYSIRMLAGAKAGQDGEQLQQNDASSEVMKKREDFAISLRKKKHNEMINTKRRANIQKSF